MLLLDAVLQEGPSRAEPAPASFAQEALWALHQLEPSTPEYNVPFIVELKGQLRVEILERALNTVIARHEVLRTSLAVVAGGLIQVIDPRLSVELSVNQLSVPGGGSQREVAWGLARQLAAEPFDLNRGPLIRVRLALVAADIHWLIFVAHHAIFDGWSLSIFLEELSILYRTFADRNKPTLPPLRLQYSDFAIWQRRLLQGPVFDAQLEYWRNELAGAPESLQLPTGRAPLDRQTRAGAWFQFDFDDGLSDSLRHLAKRQATTPAIVLLAGFSLLLARLSNKADLVVGLPVAGRAKNITTDLIGCFINSLPVRVRLSGNPKFETFLSGVRDVGLAALSHQDIPFHRLVQAVRPRRNPGRNPIFQVLFVMQNTPRVTPRIADLSAEVLELESGTSKFDLSLSVKEAARGFEATFEYSTDRFSAETVALMAEQLLVLLGGATAKPTEPVRYLPLLAESERHRIQSVPSGPSQQGPRPMVTGGQMVDQAMQVHAVKSPNALAATIGQDHLTYGDLKVAVDELASTLQDLGIGPETLVGVCMRRSFQAIISILAILRAGGAYVPLDPAYPERRLEIMARDSQLSLVLASSLAPRSIFGDERRLIRLGSDWWIAQGWPGARPAARKGPANLAYVIYTSGSTGLPKGVAITRGSLHNVIVAAVGLFRVNESSRIAQLASLSFDASALEIFMALTSGASLHIAEPAAVSGRDLAKWLDENRISTLVATPTLLKVLPPSRLRFLRTVSVGGEACAPDLVNIWAPGRRFLNLYAPTEGTIFCTSYVDGEGPRMPAGRGLPIGEPIPNTTVYLLDDCLQPVPTGSLGEIYIGGVGVARGYMNLPKTTAERFMPDPFARSSGQRMYRSGDLARRHANGSLEFAGRVDNQVKIRGFRVELGEIQAVLERHEAVKDAVVVVTPAPWGERLVAYVVAHGQPPSRTSLEEILRSNLPEYMIPSAFVSVPELPRGPNGKVDRKRLPIPPAVRPEIAQPYEPPRGPMESGIGELFGKILGIPSVGRLDNFFDLGGDSVRAAQIVAQLYDHFRVRLSLKTFFEEPSIVGLADQIQRERRRSDT